MLIRFTVSNFLSFDEEVEFNMIAGSFKTHKHHVHDIGKIKVLKSAAIYGANGAGKSNLIKAIEFLQELVVEGQIDRSIDDSKFKLKPKNSEKPSTLEIEFIIKKKSYLYGFAIDGRTVVEEWLYETVPNSTDKMIFERKFVKKKQRISFASKYKKSKKEKLLIELMEENLLLENELLIGKTDTLKIVEISNAREKLEKGLVIISPKSKAADFLFNFVTQKDFKNFSNQTISSFDTGIVELASDHQNFDSFFPNVDEETRSQLVSQLEEPDGISFLVDPDKATIITLKNGEPLVHSLNALHMDTEGNLISFPHNILSDGTQRLIDFIPLCHGLQSADTTFVIDEIDQSLHPTLLQSLVKKIMLNENLKGQFIFTTHESILLDMKVFRPDEIWFVEKDKSKGATQLYSLSEFKPRYDLDIRKGYLQGRFGAIPFMADLQELNWDQDGV